MYKIVFLSTAALFLASCSNSNQVKELQDSTIRVHDEIMPKIALFDHHVLEIDSIVKHMPELKTKRADLDTVQTKQELGDLKAKLENANSQMMDWMKDYNPDTTDVPYFEGQLRKIKDMKSLFDAVEKESGEKLSKY